MSIARLWSVAVRADEPLLYATQMRQTVLEHLYSFWRHLLTERHVEFSQSVTLDEHPLDGSVRHALAVRYVQRLEPIQSVDHFDQASIADVATFRDVQRFQTRHVPRNGRHAVVGDVRAHSQVKRLQLAKSKLRNAQVGDLDTCGEVEVSEIRQFGDVVDVFVVLAIVLQSVRLGRCFHRFVFRRPPEDHGRVVTARALAQPAVVVVTVVGVRHDQVDVSQQAVVGDVLAPGERQEAQSLEILDDELDADVADAEA